MMCSSGCPIIKILRRFRPEPCAVPSAECADAASEPVEGMGGICRLVNRSEATVLDWIRSRDFPAENIDGCWIANRAQVLEWMKKEVRSCS